MARFVPLLSLIQLFSVAAFVTFAAAQAPWPGEAIENSVNLTAIEGPGVNDFHSDLSAAVWNPVTRTLWLGRNGPGGSNSKLWAVVEDGVGGFQIDNRSGNRGEWTNFGDLEGVTQADFSEDVVFVLVEGQERIKEYDVSVYGTAVLNNNWNTRPYLPVDGGSGAEGITFVPDSALAAAGFVDQQGNLYSSTGGMGGLMFVGHQNGGAIFVFDLNRTTQGFVFVGEYLTGQNDTSGLEFDRSTGLLYVWHDAGIDVLSVSDLSSTPVSGLVRQLNILRAYDGPSSQNNEGIAVYPAGECTAGERSFFMTIDDGDDEALRWYQQFSDGCSVGNTAPTANPDELAVAEGGLGSTLVDGSLSVLDDDVDSEGDALTATLVADPNHGILIFLADGTFSYSHDGSETSIDSFTYEASDGSLSSAPTLVSITISQVDDAPVALPDSLVVSEGSAQTVLVGGATSILANDDDAEGAVLTAALTVSPSNGTATVQPDGTFLYVHDGGETTADSFSYNASDGILLSNDAIVSVTVNPENDAPMGAADEIEVSRGQVVALLTSGGSSVLENDSDAEGDVLTAILDVAPANGFLTLMSDGSFIYTHDGGADLSDSFSYRADDGVDLSPAITVSIVILTSAPMVPVMDFVGLVLLSVFLLFSGLSMSRERRA
ncbi:MAG: Ig-like domain-containing protein [Myxococcota bacterium]|nr:Ig-like domain-containing protein [Myxococcota bacterium]